MAIVRVTVASGATPFAAFTVNVNEPGAVGVPDSAPAGASDKPGGNEPDTLNVIADGLPEAANAYDGNVTPTVPLVAGDEAVNIGAAGAEATTTVTAVVASGATPFEAFNVNVNEPALVGVPLSTPAALRFSPGGSEATGALNVIATGIPEAAKAYGAYGKPTVPAGGVDTVIVGATGNETVQARVAGLGSVPPIFDART